MNVRTSSSMSRSGSMKRAPAKATLILHPPDREEVVEFCMSSENCRPVIKEAVRKWRGRWVNKSEEKRIQRQMRGEDLIRYGRSSQKNLVDRIVSMNSLTGQDTGCSALRCLCSYK